MRSAYLNDESDDRRQPLRQRLAGLLFALAIEALLILALVLSGQKLFQGGKPVEGLKTFDVVAKPDTEPSKSQKTVKRRTPPTPPRTTPPPAAPVPPTPLGPIPGLLVISREDYARSDIGKIRSAPAEVAAASEGAEGDSVATGKAPNGEPLYNAEWYREPTDAEMRFYMPQGLRSGSALIACKTARNYRVEDCVILGDDPPGTGLARGVREAAWQFRVRPPRKGGNDIIGAWVRIRFDLVERRGR
ncbi:MAG: hypothetical protein B7Y45_00195 [Sphingomonas sp. 28-66-16]|nr:MAG: hypothetical protein B7Y45_00195 [Sphingomonas sp. 28-66-16]